MLLKSLLPLSAAFSIAAAAEVHGGVSYEVRFDWNASVETIAFKDAYETEAARQASQRLQSVICKTGIAAENTRNFFDLLGNDIAEANTFWDKVITESTSDRTKWVPARVYVRGWFNVSLTTTSFATWTLSDLADQANNHANPEHYWKKTVLSATLSQSSQIFEGWGGVRSSFGMKRTNFTVPQYNMPAFGTAEYPQVWAIDSSFLSVFQRIGPKVLAYGDGNTFGVLHIAVRDVQEGDRSGLEVYAAVWYPPWDQASEADHDEFVNNYLKDESEHMIVEIVNLTLQARSDIAAGLLKVPGA